MGGRQGARSLRSARLLLLAALAALVGSAPGAAGAGALPEPPLRELVYEMLHQSAGEAAALIFPLLSERGEVEILSATSTLVVRDTSEAMERIESLLRDFDRPLLRLLLDLRLVAAETAARRWQSDTLPADLVRRLQELLRYQAYRQLGRASLELVEGQQVKRPLGSEYRVEFKLGALQEDSRVKLLGFRIYRRPAESEPLIHTNLSLWMDKPMVLGLARAEQSDTALMVVLSCSRGEGESR